MILAKKGEPMPKFERTGVSFVGQLALEREERARRAVENGQAAAASPLKPAGGSSTAPVEPVTVTPPIPKPILTERERVEAILNDPQAVGRLELARHLAVETDLSVQVALDVLRAAPADPDEPAEDPAAAALVAIAAPVGPNGERLDARALVLEDALEERARRREAEQLAAADAETIDFIEAQAGKR